jgi:hypothetical protein
MSGYDSNSRGLGFPAGTPAVQAVPPSPYMSRKTPIRIFLSILHTLMSLIYKDLHYF